MPPSASMRSAPLDRPAIPIMLGATRRDRWLFVVCEDWTEEGTRHLRPVTAFEPEEGKEYWRRR